MLSPIRQLDVTTSKSIQASLIFPTLTSVVLELVYHALNANPASSIEVYISLAPEWQITCQYDAPDAGYSSLEQCQGSSLDYLGYLGVVDVQCGQYKLIQKAGNVIFSGTVEAAIGGYAGLPSSITMRDIFRNLPVRRQSFSTSNLARSELERCRRAFSVAIVPHYSTRVTLRCTSIDQGGSRIVLDAAKTNSLLARYENLFSLCVTMPGSALTISTVEQSKGSRVEIKGFVVLSLLSSRSHQHVLFNGRLQDDIDHGSSLITSQCAANIRAMILQVLTASYIGADQAQTRGRDAKNYAGSGRYYGYVIDVQVNKLEQVDQVHFDALIRKAISQVLQAYNLLPSRATDRTHSRSRPQSSNESPTKKLRTFKVASDECACCSQGSWRHFTLDRAGLLREPLLARDQEGQAGWVQDVLSSWKKNLPIDETFEQRISTLDEDHRDHVANGCIEDTRGQMLQKEGLSTSRVIGQVDSKYISIIYKNDTLLLIDQHAAHERVRLEEMLSKYLVQCLNGQSTRVRQTKAPIQIPGHLIQSFKDEETIQSLDFWGFGIRMHYDSTVQVDAVPEILGEKLGSEQALRVFMMDLAASLEADSVRRRIHLSSSAISQANFESGWLIALRHLPSPILDLFNSMACRGAIMFNDSLTLQQCEKLIEQLSQTTFPFQCAHGRPSMVPIASLQSPISVTEPNALTPLPIRWAALSK